MSIGGRLRQTFAALGVRNFRLYFTGQLISVVGTWMQRIAQTWLVLDLTGSGTAVGAVTALQFLPMLVAPAGGLLADRIDRRTLLYGTQSVAAALALALGTLVVSDRVELWMVYGFAFGLGIVGSLDNPARRAFVTEMVSRETLTNALGLNSVLVNTARVLGPVLAGALIVSVGIGPCFLLNAVSYLGLIVALTRMHPDDLASPPPVQRRRGQLRDAGRYVVERPVLRVILVVLAVVSVFAYEYEVVLPVLARFTFGGDADMFGVMFGAVALGAIAGGLHAANITRPRPALISRLGLLFAVALVVAALAPTYPLELVALAAVGATGSSFLSISNSLLQLHSAPEMQGRVLALRAVAFLGARPIGAPIVGWISENLGARYALGMGGGAVIVVIQWSRRHLGHEATGPG